jgi:hypothetical protein
MDLKRLELVIEEFAKKHHFLQWKEVANVVTKSKPMFTKKDLQMDGKSFVRIEKYIENNQTSYWLFMDKLYFTLESSSEENSSRKRSKKRSEPYSVEIDNIFAINLSDFSDEQRLIDAILDKCNESNL